MKKASNTKKIVMVGTFSAIAFVLQMVGSMMGLKVGGFLEIEFSDLPALIVTFAYGPVAGILVELLKNFLVELIE
jgi:riboflavin transporter FmnP